MVVVAPGWEVDVETLAGWLVVTVRRLAQDDADPTPPLAEVVWRLLDQRAGLGLILDLGALEILPSYLIGQLVLLHKRATRAQRPFRLCGRSDDNRQVLHFARLDEHFALYANREEALGPSSYSPT